MAVKMESLGQVSQMPPEGTVM